MNDHPQPCPPSWPSGDQALRWPLGRRRFLQAALGAAAGVVLESCSKGGSRSPAGTAQPYPGARSSTAPPETIRQAGGDFGFPSPFAYFVGPGYALMIQIYDTLLWTDMDNRVFAWLASRYERSADGSTYTFELRDGVRWHDGKPLTADDVVFSFEYFAAKRPKLPSLIIGEPERVAGVTASGPRRAEVHLKKPLVNFPQSVAALFPIVPRHVWEAVEDPSKVDDREMLVGTGPYRLASYERGKGTYLYVANDDFFLGRPVVRRLELRPVDDALTALRAGEIDVGGAGGVLGANPRAVAPFREDPTFALAEGQEDFLIAFYFNLSKGGPMADVRVRRACAKAIDRKGLVERLLGGLGEPGNPGFLPPGHAYRVEVEQYEFDPKGAQRLLDQAGYRRSGSESVRRGPDRRALRFECLVTPPLAPVVEIVADSLRKVGVELALNPLEVFQQFPTLTEGKYETAIFFYGGIRLDPDYMRTVYSSASPKIFQKVHGYENPEFERLAEAQLVATNEQERRALVAEMQRIVARDVPMFHLYYPTPISVYRREVFDGLRPSGRADDLAGKATLVAGKDAAKLRQAAQQP